VVFVGLIVSYLIHERYAGECIANGRFLPMTPTQLNAYSILWPALKAAVATFCWLAVLVLPMVRSQACCCTSMPNA
jgi:hypothetical protein